MERRRFTNGVCIFAAMVLLSCFFTMMIVKAWDQEEASKPTRAEYILPDPDAAYHDFQLRARWVKDEKSQPEGGQQ